MEHPLAFGATPLQSVFVTFLVNRSRQVVDFASDKERRPSSGTDSAKWSPVVKVTFEDWTAGRKVASLGTNAGAEVLPFQTWRHFKEAFAPELVARAIRGSRIPVLNCLDPFGGSGTTALTCQFLGMTPTIIEVNPFLSDLIQAKLESYDSNELAIDLGKVIDSQPASTDSIRKRCDRLPVTFIQPGKGGRWLFDECVAVEIFTILDAIEVLSNGKHRRLFRVLLAGVLVEVSNAVVNGKGRRYRKNWQQRCHAVGSVHKLFLENARRAIMDIHRYRSRRSLDFELKRGDSRHMLGQLTQKFEIAIFSPPYPNSFDYTDVYNIELWMLGYLSSSMENRSLREATLNSHVQITRDLPSPPAGSEALAVLLDDLERCKADLWSPHIPAMIGAYFSDMLEVINSLRVSVVDEGSVWMVVGDSRYGGVRIEVAKILSELAQVHNWTQLKNESCRSMRSSAQQGGALELDETLLVLTPV